MDRGLLPNRDCGYLLCLSCLGAVRDWIWCFLSAFESFRDYFCCSDIKNMDFYNGQQGRPHFLISQSTRLLESNSFSFITSPVLVISWLLIKRGFREKEESQQLPSILIPFNGFIRMLHAPWLQVLLLNLTDFFFFSHCNLHFKFAPPIIGHSCFVLDLVCKWNRCSALPLKEANIFLKRLFES